MRHPVRLFRLVIPVPPQGVVLGRQAVATPVAAVEEVVVDLSL
jgi:hypothetical protein